MKGVRVLNGYRLIHKPDHPSSMTSDNWKGYMYEHIFVIEESTGVRLLGTEVVHHLDGNRSNNHLGNLIRMDRGMHLKLHFWMDNGAPIHESYWQNGMNSGKPTATEPKFCIVCNSCLQGKQKRTCSVECNSIAKRVVSRPSRDQLLLDIRSMSWLAMGEKYGVSDNAVRKWARKYELLPAILSQAEGTLSEGAETSGEV